MEERCNLIREGDAFSNVYEIAKPIAMPKNIAIAEKKIIGVLSKFSDITTAKKKATETANGRICIVSGSIKKEQTLRRSKMKSITIVSQVNPDLCVGCRTCEKVCPVNCIVVADKKAQVDTE